MGQETFTHCKYGIETSLRVGQKVECVYYTEDTYYGYRRSLLAKILDKPFRPVKLGVIVGDAGIHPYWLAGNQKAEQYLFVRFKEYIFAKAIPISCIKDAAEAAQNLESFLKRFKDKIGDPGWSEDSYTKLKNRVKNTKNFILNDKRA